MIFNFWLYHLCRLICYEELEDAKGVLRSRKSNTADNTMANRKRTKDQTMICKPLHRKLKIEQNETDLKRGSDFRCSERVSSSFTSRYFILSIVCFYVDF